MRKKHSLAYSILQAKLKGIAYKLNYAVTYQCNTRCTLCNIWKKYVHSPQKIEEEMTLEDIEHIFSQFDLSWLSLTGGEPFLRPDLHEIAVIAESHNPHLNLLTLPTNGSSPHTIVNKIDRILEETTISNIFCTVSLDGPEELHDQLRGVKGMWKQAKKSYELLKELENERFSVFIEFTLSRYNAGQLLDALRSFHIKEFSRVVVTAAHASHFYGTHPRPLHTETSLDQIDEFMSLFRRGKIESIITRVYVRLLKKYLTNTLHGLPCVSGRSSFFLDPYGILYPCITMNTPFGNITESSFNQVLQSERSISIIHKIKEGTCPGCWTPCEAYQTILERLPAALKASMWP